MRKFRLERTDLNQFKNRTIKEYQDREIDNGFATADEFLNFLNEDSIDINVLNNVIKIIEALESNPLFVQNVEIYEVLQKRFGREILNDDDKIKAVYTRIATILCTNMGRFIRILQNNQDIILLKILYTSDYDALKAEILHFLANIFSIFALNNLQILKNWWRFQFFMQNAVQCLIEFVSCRNAFMEQKLSVENIKTNKKKEKLTLSALGILLEIAHKFPFFDYHLKISNDWFSSFYKSFNEQSYLLQGIMMKILNCWLDSPIIRNNGKYYMVIQQLFAPISEMIVFQRSNNELNMMNEVVDSCKYSLLNLLNNWPGLFTLFSTEMEENRLEAFSCFRIFEYIGKNTILTPNIAKVQCSIVDLICELLALPYANCSFNSGSWDKEFQNYENVFLPDSYDSSLNENFILSEIAYIDSTQMQFYGVDLLKTFRIVLTYALINAGIHEALIRLILQNPNQSVSIKATFLLADLFKLSTNLPQNVKFECLSIYKLIQQTVNAFQSRTFKQLAENNDNRQREEISSLNYIFSNIYSNNEMMENYEIRNSNGNYRNSLLLIDRLEQINGSKMKPISLSNFPLLNSYLNLDSEFRRRRGNSILSRHSYSTGNPTYEENKVIEETLPNDDFDDLLAKAFEQNIGSNDNNELPAAQSSNLFNITGIGVGLLIFPMQNQSTASSQNKGKPVWNIVWKILSILDDQISIQSSKMNFASKIVDKSVPFFNQIIQFFLPSNQHLFSSEIEPMVISCGQFIFHLLCIFENSPLAIGTDNSRWASDLLTNFLYDFCSHLNPSNLESVFSPRNLLCTTSFNYFTILRVLSSHLVGMRHFEQTAITQILLDRISSDQTSAELIKLIISSLNYFSIGQSDTLDGNQSYFFARNLLENVLHSNKSLTIRKWSTRFLDSFFILNNLGYLRNFDWKWAIKLLIRQLSDPKIKIVRLATDILLKWLPFCPQESIKEIKELLKHANLEALDNLGNLLEIFIYNDLDHSSNTIRKMARISLQKWKESFSLCYLDIVEERLRKALIPNNINSFCHKRSMNGNFARASNQESKRVNSRVISPIHLYGQLARSLYGQKLLEEYNIFGQLEQILLKFLFIDNSSVEESFLRMVKSAIFGLAHILSNLPCNQPHLRCKINYFTKLIHACLEQKSIISPWLTIRGCALFGLNIAAKGNYSVATILYEIGWEFGENNEIPSFGKNPLKDKQNESLLDNFPNLFSTDALPHFASVNSSNVSRKYSGEQNPSKFDYTKLADENIVAINEIQRIQRRVFSESEEIQSEFFEEKHLTSYSSSCEEIKYNTLKQQNNWRLIDKLSLEKAKRLYPTAFQSNILANGNKKDFTINYQELKRKMKPNIISEKENSELINYQKFLSPKAEYGKTKTILRSMDSFSFCNKTIDRCSIILPKNIQILFGNIIVKMNENKRQNQFYQPNIKNHNKWMCLYCSNSNVADQNKKVNRHEIIELIYQIVNQLSNIEPTIKLLRVYENNPEYFKNSCIFSDVLRIIADSRIGFEGKKLIYQLFWDSI